MCVRDAVEGQNTGWPVQIHSYSIRYRWRGRNLCAVSLIIVPGSVNCITTVKIPGLVIESKPTVNPTFSPDSFICHCYMTPASQFNLPVTASSQTLSTQNLLIVLKSLWMISIRLWLFHTCCISVLRQNEMSVCCVWIQCEITGIWTKEEKTHHLWQWLSSLALEVHFLADLTSNLD